MEEREEFGGSDVMVPRETVGHLAFFSWKPFREQDGGMVEQELGGHTSDPETEGRRAGPAVVEARMVEPSRGCRAVSIGEDDGTRWDVRHGRFKSELDVAGEIFEGV